MMVCSLKRYVFRPPPIDRRESSICHRGLAPYFQKGWTARDGWCRDQPLFSARRFR